MSERKAKRPFERILAGLDDALAFARGDTSRAKLYRVVNGEVVEVPPESILNTSDPIGDEGGAISNELREVNK